MAHEEGNGHAQNQPNDNRKGNDTEKVVVCDICKDFGLITAGNQACTFKKLLRYRPVDGHGAQRDDKSGNVEPGHRCV